MSIPLNKLPCSNQNVAMTEMERRIEVYKKEAETARKWSASLANLHHIKVRVSKTIRFILLKVSQISSWGIFGQTTAPIMALWVPCPWFWVFDCFFLQKRPNQHSTQYPYIFIFQNNSRSSFNDNGLLSRSIQICSMYHLHFFFHRWTQLTFLPWRGP